MFSIKASSDARVFILEENAASRSFRTCCRERFLWRYSVQICSVTVIADRIAASDSHPVSFNNCLEVILALDNPTTKNALHFLDFGRQVKRFLKETVSIRLHQ